MDRLFGSINNLFRNKYFRALTMLVALCIMFYSYLKFNSRFIDKRKLSSVLEMAREKVGVKKSGKYVSSAIDGSREVSKTVVKKKQLGPDFDSQRGITPMEGKIKNVTNILLKLKILEDNYVERRKNNKIDHSRVAREGDRIYYSMEVKLGEGIEASQQSHLFMKLSRNDIMGKKLIGKKIGQVVEYGYSELTAGLGEKEKKSLESSMNSIIGNANSEYSKRKTKLFDSTKIRYRISILDFIPWKTVKSLALE